MNNSLKRLPERIYTLTETAELCDVNRVTLWRWVKAGKLNAYKTPTGQYRIKERDLKRFIQKKLSYIELADAGPSRTVLIVDDNPSFRKIVKKILARDGFQIEEASNGFEAGVKIVKFNPALVILDLFMPKMDGFDLCRRIKGDSGIGHVKVLAVTGQPTPETEKRILQLGADGYLKKPFGHRELIARVNQLIH